MKLFEKPWLELVKLYAEDIVTISDGNGFGADDLSPDVDDSELPD